MWVQANGSQYTGNDIFHCDWGIVADSGTKATWGCSMNAITNNIVRQCNMGGILLRTEGTPSNVSQNLVQGNVVINSGLGAAFTYPNVWLYGTNCMWNAIIGNSIQSWEVERATYHILFSNDAHDNSALANHCVLSTDMTGSINEEAGATHNSMQGNFTDAIV
jgi:hypothetical protein